MAQQWLDLGKKWVFLWALVLTGAIILFIETARKGKHLFVRKITALEAVTRGYFLSFSGTVTYPKNEELRAAAATVPEDRLLVETDSPFLTPQALRGQDNRPGNATHVLEALATARDASAETMRKVTAENARVAFPGLR